MRTVSAHRWLLTLVVVALAVAGAFTSLGAAPAHASSCTDSWTGAAADGNWDTAANWSTGVPVSTDNVCITLAGTYTVTLAGGTNSTTVASLTVGGATGAQTVEVRGINGSGNLALTAGSVNVGANGAILIDCQTPALPCSTSGNETLQVTTGELDNAGTLTTDAPNTINLDGNITNSGTINVESGATSFGQGSLVTPVTLNNQGALQISNNAGLQTSQTVHNDTGGSIDAGAGGTLTVSSGTFNEGAGTTSGTTPVTLINSSNLEYTGAGVSAITLSAGGGTFTLGGTMAADQSLTLEGVATLGDPVVDVAGGFINNGAITIGCEIEPAATPCSIFGSETFQVPSGAMTNNGTITTTAANTVNVDGNIDNGTTGAINIDDAAAIYGQGASATPVTLNNSGALAIADGSLLQTTQAVSNNLGGSIAVTGSGTLSTSGQFNEGAGTTSGATPVTLINGATLNDTGSGAATFLMQSGGNFGLEGTLAATQTLTVEEVDGTGDSVVSATAGFINAGAIHLVCTVALGSGSPCSIFGHTTLQVSSGTMTNSGLITTTAVSATNLDGNIINTGQITVENTSTIFGQGIASAPPTLDNEGEILLTANSQLSTDPSAAATITNDDGGSVVADAGGQLTVNVGTFNEGAGTTSGVTPVVLINNSTLNYTGTGASSILMYGGGDYTLSGNLAPADTLTVQGVNGSGDSQVFAGAFTNAGTLTLGCHNPPPASSPTCSGGYELLSAPTLTNDGVFNATAANAIEETGNLINNGTLSIGGGGDTATLDLDGAFTQSADGVFAAEVAGPSAASLLDVTGSPTLDGTLSLTPTAAYASSATLGDVASVLTYTGARSGTFAHTVLSPTNITPPLIGGNAQIGQPPLTCSTGSWTGSPGSFTYQWLRDGTPISGAHSSAYSVVAADIGHALTCAVTASAGAALTGGNGFGVIYDDAGFAVQSVVSSSFQSGSTTAVSAGKAVGAPAITLGPSALTPAVGANPYAQALLACGGSLPTCEEYSTTTGALLTSTGASVPADAQYTFALVGGSLPAGLTLTAQGLLFGTPTEAGTFNIVVQATDPLGEHGDGAFALTVVPGVSLRTADGSFVLGGAIPFGDATVTPDSSDPISSVSMSASGVLSVPVTGAAGGGSFGLQLSGGGLACNSSLEVTDAAGTLFKVAAVPTTGCATLTANGAPVVEPLAQTTPAASAGTATTASVEAHSAGLLQSSGTISFSPGQTSSLGTDTVSAGGTFDITFPPVTTGPVRVTVTGGDYTSELDGTIQTTTFPITTIVDSTLQLPPIIPVTPISQLIAQLNPGTQIANGTPVTAKSPYPTNVFTDYGFPSGTQAWTEPPTFVTAVGAGTTPNPTSILQVLEGEIGTLGVSNQGSLVTALQQDIADGVFSGQPNGQPLPLGSATLPVPSNLNLFATGLSPGDIIPVTSLPVLPPIVSAPIEIIPVSPIPLPTGQAAVTRIGPAAFSETLTANAPAGAQPPFSTTSDTFTIEVVAAN